uniref:Rhodopsin domain-containing protein n=1 Tax=Bionectria ochroleuca TaxID=29856 RepID=A0A8H7NIF1_BIOOC
MVVLLVMRFHTRIRISGLGMDDYLCALAAVGIVAYVALCLSAIELSGGRHLWDIPLAKLTPTYVRLCNILANVYMVTAMLIKIALLIQYRRIFHPSPVANLLLWFGIVSTALIYIICMCILLAYCVPRPEDYPLGGWVSLSYSNRCRMPSAYVVLLSGILGTVIDIYVLTIPLAFLWGLKTTVKRKAGLSAIFLAGSAACIFSIVGVVYRVKMVTADE